MRKGSPMRLWPPSRFNKRWVGKRLLCSEEEGGNVCVCVCVCVCVEGKNARERIWSKVEAAGFSPGKESGRLNDP